MQRLAHDGQLSAYRHMGYWQSMDTLRDKMVLEEEWAKPNPAWKIWS
jgi:glucose-1-phosphate cytidylyltransferase